MLVVAGRRGAGKVGLNYSSRAGWASRPLDGCGDARRPCQVLVYLAGLVSADGLAQRQCSHVIEKQK